MKFRFMPCTCKMPAEEEEEEGRGCGGQLPTHTEAGGERGGGAAAEEPEAPAMDSLPMSGSDVLDSVSISSQSLSSKRAAPAELAFKRWVPPDKEPTMTTTVE